MRIPHIISFDQSSLSPSTSKTNYRRYVQSSSFFYHLNSASLLMWQNKPNDSVHDLGTLDSRSTSPVVTFFLKTHPKILPAWWASPYRCPNPRSKASCVQTNITNLYPQCCSLLHASGFCKHITILGTTK